VLQARPEWMLFALNQPMIRCEPEHQLCNHSFIVTDITDITELRHQKRLRGRVVKAIDLKSIGISRVCSNHTEVEYFLSYIHIYHIHTTIGFGIALT
jgi:hypothetical protein